MLFAQAVSVNEIPGWVVYVFALALIVVFTVAVRWILSHPTPE
jgi:hypothetical protein